MAKLTQKQLIDQFKSKHGNTYDYSKVIYQRNNVKVTIICRKHGEFVQAPSKHKIGRGCPHCNGTFKLTTKSVVERFHEVHGDKYDYSKVHYLKDNQKVIITCPMHGDFKQTPNAHKQGRGCSQCVGKNLNQKQIILAFKEMHGSKYDYSKVNYQCATSKVEIICSEHGSFLQTPSNHKKGVGCPSCYGNILLTNEKIIEQFREIHGKSYDYSKVNYKGAKTKVEIICPDHGSFFQSPSSHKKGIGCKECGVLNSSKKRIKSLDNVISAFKQAHGNKYDYSKVNYIDNLSTVEIICLDHGSFFQSPKVHKRGGGCQKCGSLNVSKKRKLSIDHVVSDFTQVHGIRYDYSKVNYVNANIKVEIICTKHGSFFQTPSHHKKGVGCPNCYGRDLSKEQLILIFKQVHGNKYDYSKVKYKGSKIKVEIVCSEHGSFFQTSGSHKNGQGCPSCSGTKALNTELIIQKFQEIHGNRYDYSRVKYVNTSTKVEIICPEHGLFFQSPDHHKRGVRCPICAGGIILSREQVISAFEEVHGNRYDYSKVVYVNAKTKVEIVCHIHGQFFQSPESHKSGKGCYTCNKGWSNKKIIEFLESIEFDQLKKMDDIELLTIINQGKLPDKLKSLVFNQELNREHSIKALKEKLLNEDQTEEANEETQFINEIQNEEPINSEIINEEEFQTLNKSDNKNDNELISLANNFDDLHGLDHPIAASCDKEAIEFLIQYKLRRFWNKTLNKEIDINAFRKEKGGRHFKTLKETFLSEYKQVEKYKPPTGYKFPYSPNMMQKLTVFRIKKNKRYGNWSGTGAGKTVSFIITSREIESKLTVLVGLNSNMNQLGEDILEVFPDSKIYYNSKNYSPPIGFQFHYYKKGLVFDRSQNNFLIINYDKFQQNYSESLFQDLTSNNQIDFICIDEIHNVKQRTEEQESKRRATLKRLIGRAFENNDNLHVLGMSATPVINNLKEAKSLLEMVTGKNYDDLSTARTLNNAIESFKHLTLNGLRYKPKYDIVLKELTGENSPKLKIDGTEVLDRLLKLGNTNYSKAEQILIDLKLNAVKPKIEKGTVIYTYFTTRIVKPIISWLTNLGYKVGTYTGNESNKERGENKKAFMKGQLDILVGSKPIGTGVNGLQYVCKKMIIISLPWTDSEYTQLKGRIYRQGSKFGEVEIIIPQIYIPLEDKEWSWDLQRLNLIRNKKTLADAAVDGVIPNKTIPSPKTLFKKSQEALKAWKERLSKGDERIISREDLKFPLHPDVLDILQRKLGDFSALNQKWSTSNSKKTHKRIQGNPEEWFLYHELYSEKRKSWPEIPFKVIASWIKRKDFIVADLGCGQNLLKEEIKENTVYSFDHHAIDSNVVACDIASVPIKDDSVDISVLCLALMGSNSKDYIKEAYRITRPMGHLFIAEPKKKHIDKIEQFTELLNEIGFGNVAVDVRENFIYWKCVI